MWFTLKKVMCLGILAVMLMLPGHNAFADIIQNTQNIKGRTTIAVMPFFASGGDKEAWLSKGLADLLIGGLGQVEKYAVLERSQLQDFIKELELGAFSGDNENVKLVGKVAAVNQVIYGQYDLTGSTIDLKIFVHDVASGNVVHVIERKGSLGNIRALAQEIAIEISKKSSHKITDQELENIRFSYTDSLPAIKRFYQGIDFYDQGKYADAMGAFLAAYQKDKTYNEALFWVGRMQQYQQMTEHALSTYEKLYHEAPDQVIAQDAILFAGKLSQDDLQDLQKAYDLFSLIYERPEYTAQKLMAAYHMAEIKQNMGEGKKAYELLEPLEDFVFKKVQKPRYQRQSSYFNWRQIYDLKRSVTRDMLTLYAGFSFDDMQASDLPVGAFLLDLENPRIDEKYKKTKPFLAVQQGGYSERYYAVIVPKGYQASTVHLKISGVCNSCYATSTDYSIQVHRFPLPRDHFSNWLGTLYGQTAKRASLQKKITFNGENQSVMILKLNEGGGTIFNWGIEANLVVGDEKFSSQYTKQKTNNAFKGEGAVVSEIHFKQAQDDGAMDTMMRAFYGDNKREVAIEKDGLGIYHIVIAAGDIQGARTDLWHSSSMDLKNWTPSKKLSVSSLRKDFFPRFVKAEDGALHLFWLSNRRGGSWMLWTSRYDDKKKQWSEAHLIPFTHPQDHSKIMPHYTVMQTSRGLWVLAYRNKVQKSILLRSSYDLKEWRQLPDFEGNFLSGIDIMEDATGKWRMMGHSNKFGSSMMYESNDGKAWNGVDVQKICKGFLGLTCSSGSGNQHSVRVLKNVGNKVLFLTSDRSYGLKFAIFDPYGKIPKIDLVTKTNSQPYDVLKDGKDYLVALKEAGKVTLRRYRAFKTHPESKHNGQIYNEVEYDDQKNRWDRIFATMRFIMPDVTATDVGPDGTRWWGIETGIMALMKDNFFRQDVTGGYFYHYTSIIESCDAGCAYVASDQLKHSRIGFVDTGVSWIKKMMRDGQNQTIILEGGKGAVTDLLCGAKPNTVYASTDKGDLFLVNRGQSKKLYSYPSGGITSLSNTMSGELKFATSDGKIFTFSATKGAVLFEDIKTLIYDIAEDKDGYLWIAAKDKGLLQASPKRGSIRSYDVAYKNIGELVADLDKGVWYISGGETKSRGLGYFDGTQDHLYNPTSHTLDQPSDLTMDQNGNPVIGTWFDGLYTFTLKDKE